MDIRNVAVTPASKALLDELGVWQEQQAIAYSHMRVWEEQGTRSIDFDAADVQRNELGWIVENGPLVASLWKRLRAQDGITIHTADRLVGVEPGTEAVKLHLIKHAQQAAADTRAVRARLVVAADGARSAVRQLLNVPVEAFATGHHALATAIRTAKPHRGTAFQRFLLDGPLALLPGRHPQQSSVVWSQSPASAERRAAQADDAFCQEIAAASEHCLGAVEAVDRRLVFPLQQMLAASFNPVPRVLLIGDAGRVLHPLAGLGANLGFEDVRDLLDELGRLLPGADPGATGAWLAFARRRRVRSRLMVDIMGGLRRVYASNDPLLQWVRNIGVAWVDSSALLKRQIIREALGLGPLARVSGR
jgi:2-octaprenylphenol hydroxylase